jgi:hypothetical protein
VLARSSACYSEGFLYLRDLSEETNNTSFVIPLRATPPTEVLSSHSPTFSSSHDSPSLLPLLPYLTRAQQPHPLISLSGRGRHSVARRKKNVHISPPRFALLCGRNGGVKRLFWGREARGRWDNCWRNGLGSLWEAGCG